MEEGCKLGVHGRDVHLPRRDSTFMKYQQRRLEQGQAAICNLCVMYGFLTLLLVGCRSVSPKVRLDLLVPPSSLASDEPVRIDAAVSNIATSRGPCWRRMGEASTNLVVGTSPSSARLWLARQWPAVWIRVERLRNGYSDITIDIELEPALGRPMADRIGAYDKSDIDESPLLGSPEVDQVHQRGSIGVIH